MSGGGRIGALVKKLEAMASPSFRASLSAALAAEAQRQYRKDFASGTDPYGAAWPKGKKKSGKTNIVTGYMRASGEPVTVSAEGFSFKVYAPYAPFRHYGTRYAAATPLVPIAARGLGLWAAPFNRIAARAVRELMRGPE